MQTGLSTYLSFIFILVSDTSIETKIFPRETGDVLLNPHMGWVMEERLRDVEVVMDSATPNDGDWGNVQTIMLRSGWALLNPEEEVYDWTLFDEAFEYWTGEGKDISLRIVTDGNIMDGYRGGCPEWVNAGLRQMGYRLIPVKVQYPHTIKQDAQWYIRHTWQNTVGGRLFVPHNVKFYLMTNNTVIWSFHDWNSDLVTVVQGENPEIISYFPCPAESDLPNGTYDLRVAVVDSNGTADVQLPLPDGDELNRYKIGIIIVDRSATIPSLPVMQGFESGTASGTGFELSADSTVSSLSNVITGAYSVMVNVPTTNRWETILNSTEPWDAGAIYKVSFKYYLIRDQGGTLADPGYMEFTARSPSSGTVSDRGRTCWMDEAGLTPAEKTVYVTLGNYNDYRFQWNMHWGGEIALDDISIEKVTDGEAFYSQDFETGIFGVECWPFENSGISTSDALEGTYSINGSSVYDPETLSPHWTNLLGCQPGFETNSCYTLSFSYKQLAAADWGGYNYVYLKTPTGGVAEEKCLLKWIDLPDAEVRKTVTFTTDVRTDYRLVWGLRNGGRALVDDITIIKNN